MATTDDIFELRRRVEALEQRRAATEQSSATDVDSALLRTGMVTAHHLATIREALPPKPAPTPAADRPLWAQMATTYDETPEHPEDWAAVLDVVADWFDSRDCHGSAHDLRIEARRAREGRE